MKTKRFTKTAVATIALALMTLGGCENFMKLDSDFKNSVRNEVKVANAEQITVNIAPENTGMGSTTPYPSAVVKLEVPFSIAASADADCGFVRWAAFLGAASTTEVSGIVSFADPKAAITTATLLAARSDVFIRPIFEDRPKVARHLPNDNSGLYNATIIYTFNKPIDPSSFEFSSGIKTQGGKFKNISIKTRDTYESLESGYFTEPSLSGDGLVLTIPFKNSTGLIDKQNYVISVVLSKNIRDTSGLTMAKNDEYEFTVGEGSDSTPPMFLNIQASYGKKTAPVTFSIYTDGNTVANWKTRRVGSLPEGKEFVMMLTGSDAGSGVSSAKYVETVVCDSFGNSIGQKSLLSTWNLAGNSPYMVRYTSNSDSNKFKTTSDGLISFDIYLMDNAGNPNETTDKTQYTKTYSIVRDTMAPPADDAQIKRIAIPAAGEGTAGYYNATADIPFEPSGIVDYGEAPYRSEKNYFRFSFNKDSVPLDSDEWKDASLPTSISVSGYTESDNDAVPIYFQLKDDLGNASNITLLDTVAIDKTPPTGTIAVTEYTKIGTKDMIGSYNAIPVTVVGTDATAGIKQFCAKGGDGDTQPSAPTANDTGWTDYSTTTTNTKTVSAATNANGTKHVWVWFRDKAGNVSAAIRDTQNLVLDNADPVVTRFFVNKSTAFANNATPAQADKQYSNSTELNFAFTATEATGIGSFSYSADDGVTWSKFFPVNTTAAQTDVDHPAYGVSLCNSAEYMTGTFLVTGKLRIPAVDGNVKLQIKVGDVVRGTTGLTAYNTDNASVGALMYDATPPAITAESIISAGKYDNGTVTYVNTDSVKIEYSASDALSGLNTRAFTGSLGASIPTASLGTTDTEKLPEGLKAVTDKSDTLTLSGGDGAKTVTLTVNDWAGNSGFKNFSIYVDTKPPTFELRLGNTSAATPHTNATAGGISLFGPNTTSKSWSSMYTYMTTHNDAGGSEVDLTKSNQEMRVYRLTNEDIAKALAAGDITANALGYSGLASAFKGDPLTGYALTEDPPSQAVIPRDTSVNPVMVTPHLGKTITLPTDTLTADAKPLSGFYVAGFVAIDRVGKKSPEQKIGYFYDETKPAISGLSIVGKDKKAIRAYAGASTATSAEYFIPYQDFAADPLAEIYLRLAMTDRPSTDKSGSGLDGASMTAVLTHYPMDRSSSKTDESYTISGADSTGYFDADDGKTHSIRFNTPGNYYAGIGIKPTLYDKVGNKFDGIVYTIWFDDMVPSETISSVLSAGFESGAKYSNGTLSFSVRDPESPSTGNPRKPSGMGWYAVDTDSTPPETVSGSWVSVDDNEPVSVNLTTYLTPNVAPASVFLHLRDNAGNTVSKSLGTVSVDTIHPAIRAASAASPYSGWNFPVPFGNETDTDPANHIGAYVDGKWYVNQDSFYMRSYVSDRGTGSTSGSGIARIRPLWAPFVPKNTESIESYEYAVNPSSDSGAGSILLRQFDATQWTGLVANKTYRINAMIVDAAGNHVWTASPGGGDTITTAEAATNCVIAYDGASPVISAASVSGINSVTIDGQGEVKFCGKGSKVTLTVNDTASSTTAGASGFSGWALGIGSTVWATTTQKTAWQSLPSPGDTPVSEPGSDVLNLSENENFIETGKYKDVYIFARDNAGNISAGTPLGKFSLDSVDPYDVTVTPTVSGSPGFDSQYYVMSSDASVSCTAKDAGTGIGKYYFTTNATAAGDTTIFDNATAFTLVAKDNTQLLSFASKLSTSEARPVYLDVCDVVGNVFNTHFPVTGHPLILDDTQPLLTSATVTTGAYTKVDKMFSLNVVHGGDAGGSGIKTIALHATSGTFADSQGTIGGANLGTHDEDDIELLVNPVRNAGTISLSDIILETNATFTVTLKDAAGNVAITVPSLTVKIDPEAPTVVATLFDIDNPDATDKLTWTNSTTCSATLSVTDETVGIATITLGGTGLTFAVPTVTYGGVTYDTVTGSNKITLDGSNKVITLPAGVTFTTGSYVVTGVTGFSSSNMTATFTLADKGKNTGDDTDTIGWDTASPPLTITPPGGAYPTSTNALKYYSKGDSILFTLYALDDGSSGIKTLTVDGTTVASFPTSLATGDHTLTATDKAGNKQTRSVSVAKDIAGPAVTVNGSTYAATSGSLYVSGSVCFADQIGVDVSFTESSSAVSYYIDTATNGLLTDAQLDAIAAANWKGVFSDSSAVTGTAGAGNVRFVPASASATAVYLYFKDVLGNYGHAQLKYSDTVTSWQKDVDTPSFAVANIKITDDDSKVSGFTNGGTCTVEVTYTEAASGIGTITLSGMASAGKAVILHTETSGIGEITPTAEGVYTIPSGKACTSGTFTIPGVTFSEGKTDLGIVLEDRFGHKNAKVTKSVVWDDKKPTAITVVPSGSGMYPTGSDQSTYYTAGDSVTFNLSAVDDGSSGIAQIGYDATHTVGTGDTLTIPVNANTYTLTAIDKAGNTFTKSLTVTKDTDGPVLDSVSYAADSGMLYPDTGNKVCYAQDKVLATIAVTDPVKLKEYYVASSAEAVDFSTITGWQSTYNTGSPTVADTLGGVVSFSVPASTQNVWLYLKDRFGNISATKLTYNTTVTQWVKDGSDPTISTGSGSTANITSVTVSGITVDGDKPDVYVSQNTCTFYPWDKNSSGVSKCLVTDSSTYPSDAAWSSVSAWSSGDVSVTLKTYLPSDGTETTLFIFVRDNVGNVNRFQIIKDADYNTFCLDTTPPTCEGAFSENTDSPYVYVGTFTDTTETTGTGILYYRDANPGDIVLKYSKPNDVSGNSSESSFTLTNAEIINSTSPTRTLVDGLGNTRTVTFVCKRDTTPPSFTVSGADSNGSSLRIVAKDDQTGDSGIISPYTPNSGATQDDTSETFDVWCNAVDTWADGVDSGEDITEADLYGSGWREKYIKDTQPEYILLYDGINVTNSGGSTDLPDGTTTNNFIVKATDNVGNIKYALIKRSFSGSSVGLTLPDVSGTYWTASRRAIVPPSGGKVAKGFEIEQTNPVINAWSATGDDLIDWNAGSVGPARTAIAAGQASVAAVSLTTATTGSPAVNRSTGATAAAAPDMLESLHRLALERTGFFGPAAFVAATGNRAAVVGDRGVSSGTRLLPDSFVENRLKAFIPLAEKFMKLRGIRMVKG